MNAVIRVRMKANWMNRISIGIVISMNVVNAPAPSTRAAS